MQSPPKHQVGRTPEKQGVPLLDLGRQYATLRQQIAEALLRVCDSGQFVLGPDVDALEKNLAAQCGVRHAIGCASYPRGSRRACTWPSPLGTVAFLR